MKLVLIGMNHTTADVAVREHFALATGGEALQKLVSKDEIDEAVLVSTCNRVDVVVCTRRVDDARHLLERFFHHELAGGAPIPGGISFEEVSYEYRDLEAVRHIFRVASSIDSMVVGEPQILGQLKDAYQDAMEVGSCGPILSRLFQRAFATAKRVKNETRVSERPVSVARVAVDLARQIFENFEDKRALLIGAGEMIEAALVALQHEGLQETHIVNRTESHARELAERFGARAHGLSQLDALLPGADVLLTCIGGAAPILTVERLRSALRVRRNRPVFAIDIGVPRNIDPQVDTLDNVYLYDVDDLQGVASSNVAERQRDSEKAERIVLEEQQRFAGWLVALKSVPAIRHLRARARAISEQEIERYAGRLGLTDEQREGVERLTTSIVNKILHAPVSRLRAETEREEGMAMREAARALFALDDPEAPGAQADDDLLLARLGELEGEGPEESES